MVLGIGFYEGMSSSHGVRVRMARWIQLCCVMGVKELVRPI